MSATLQEHLINGLIWRNWKRGLPGSAARSDKAETRLKCAVFASTARCDVSDNWPAWWRFIFHGKATLAVGRLRRIQARRIPERLNRCRAARELRVEPRPPALGLGFAAVWVDFGIPRGFRLPEALRFPGMRPPGNTDAVRTIPNVTTPSPRARTARVKVDRSVCEFDPTSVMRATTIPRNPPSTLWIMLGVPFTAARQLG